VPRTITAARWVRRGCLAGAAALALAATLPLSGAAAATPAPDFTFSGGATAFGVQYQLNSNPEPTPVSDVVDVQTPLVNTQLDNFGTADASGKLASAGGAELVPGLVCLASPQFCGQFPAGVYPPANPVEAHATYPKPQDATAPAAGGQAPTGFGSDGNAAAFGSATSHADLRRVDSVATGGSSEGGAGAVGSRSSTSHVTQRVDGEALVSRAEAVVNGISIGGAQGINIDSVTAVTEVRYPAKGKPADTSTVTVQGATVAGNPAVIDSNGIHIVSAPTVPVTPGVIGGTVTGGGQAVLDQLNAALAGTLKASHLSVRTIGTSSSDDPGGHQSSAQGVLVTFDGTPTGLPSLNTGQIPEPCMPFPGFPINPCAGVSQNPNALYYGQVLYGAAGTHSSASPAETFDLPDLPGLSDLGAAALTPSVLPAATSGASRSPTTGRSPAAAPVPAAGGGGGPAGTAGTTGTVGIPGSGGDSSGALVTGAANPTAVAGTTAAVASAGTGGAGQASGGVPIAAGPASPAAALLDPLDGVGGRLRLLFPALLLGGIAVLAGRLRRAPPRLPAGR